MNLTIFLNGSSLTTLQFVSLNQERNLLQEVAYQWKLVLSIILFLALLIGLYFKSVIFGHFRCIKLLERPINVLILLEQIVHTFCNIFVGSTHLLSLLLAGIMKFVIVFVAYSVFWST